MSTLAVVRHTRQNEETGRAELIGSAVVGHLAPLTAALLVVAGADLRPRALSMGVLVAIGLPASGSLLFGAAIAGTRDRLRRRRRGHRPGVRDGAGRQRPGRGGGRGRLPAESRRRCRR